MTPQAYTLERYVSEINNESITMKSLHTQEIIGEGSTKLLLNDLSVLRLYWKEIEAESVMLTLSTNEKLKYFYKPWLFCHDTYGNSELWFELLKLNQIRSFSEFDHETIRVFPTSIISKIRTIMNLEEEIISMNKSEILQKKKEVSLE